MSWLLNLYETYEANLDRVGKPEMKRNGEPYTLLPICHTTQTAHIEVVVTEDGSFHSATVVESNANTLIPCTEDSANRAGSKVAPYPLHDKLSYVAGDAASFGGEFKKDNPFEAYIQLLGEWASSPHATDHVKSIYRYVSKRQLIADLVRERILFTDEHNRLIQQWDNTKHARLSETRPKIYSVVTGDIFSAFVRFTVRSPHHQYYVWEDPGMYESFIRFYSERLGDKDWCYVTGTRQPCTDKHANKIRNPADKAKLISANDTSGFTFRGRFKTSQEAASIGYDVSQKAHNALKWLINRQATIIDQRVFLTWGTNQPNVPDPLEDRFSLDAVDLAAKQIDTYTYEDVAKELSKSLAGYRSQLKTWSDRIDELEKQRIAKVNILVLDSATTGRMAVLYYRNMDLPLYFDRLIQWHTSCVWLHRYRKNDKGEHVMFVGAPSVNDIAFAAYGPKADSKIVKGMMMRVLPCIVDGHPVPSDIVANAVRKASNPESMETWEWEKTLSVACALVNQSRKEKIPVALDLENDNRDYLFGRLLAVADVLERRALTFEEKRPTNAIRFMNAFAQHPARTWKTIQQCLQPYQAKLGADAHYLSRLIDEIGSRIPVSEFTDKPLSDVYLLGYYSQRQALYTSSKSQQSNQDAANAGN